MKAPFPYFGGKSKVADLIWARFGEVQQYIEPFCGSAAVLLAAPRPASLEVVGDASGFVANFWRAIVHQADQVARWADYPVSHVDLGARHKWLMDRRPVIAEGLADAEWPGDAQAAGWWLWGQCAWIGSGWCEWEKDGGPSKPNAKPHTTDAGRGIQAAGKIPFVGNAGRGVQAVGKIPSLDAGRGVQAVGKIPQVSSGKGYQALTLSGRADGMWTTAGSAALRMLQALAARLERVRVIHGSWDRTLNHHFGGESTAVFLDPPYDGFEGVYAADSVAAAVAAWALEHEHLRVCLAGHRGDYDLPGWDAVEWSRGRLTYGGAGTTAEECLWFSPACITVRAPVQQGLGF